MPPLMPSHAALVPGPRLLLAAQAHHVPVPEGVRVAARALACWAHALDRPDRKGRP